jgi:hypothetical protein
MKTLKYIAFILLFSNCTAQSNLTNVVIEYSAVTRGTSIEIKVTSKEIKYKKNEATKVVSLVAKQRKVFEELLEKINLENLETFIVPTSNSHSDRALQAALKITKNEKIYVSQTFDHGNPPKELKTLLDWIFKKWEI